jgi:hypothetical protein
MITTGILIHTFNPLSLPATARVPFFQAAQEN